MLKLLYGNRLARSALVVALLLSFCSAYLFMSARPALAASARSTVALTDPGDNYPTQWRDPVPQDSVADTWGEYNRECTSWASFALSDRNHYQIPFHDYASNWGAKATAIGYPPDNTPAVGTIAWWAANAPGASQYGHVAWVSNVDQGGGITVEQYNLDYTGHYSTSYFAKGSSTWPTGFIHFPGSGSSSSDNTVIAVKKLTQSDGTNEVIWAKKTDVFESWWRGTSGINLWNIINIAQGDIVGFDVALYSSGEHDLFVATAHNVWEVWWYPGQGTHTAEILSNIGNIHAIQKTMGPDGVTHQLYVMTDAGVSEYWWNSGSNGVHGGSIYSLANPVGIYKALEHDGTQALYIADQNYAYMLHWGSGINGIQVTTVINVSGITALSFSEDSDGKHRLYVGASSGAIWEASWYAGGSIGDWYMTGGAPVVALQKWEDDSEQVLYEATAGGVFEYYWPTTSNSLSSDTIKGGLSNVHAFVRSTDPNGVQSVYTATGTNILESWWIPGGNGITTSTIE